MAGAFVYTPPFPLLLSVMPGQAGMELAQTLVSDGLRLPGVTGRHELTEAFVKGWRTETGADFTIWERRRLYRLQEVRDPATAGRASGGAAASAMTRR